MKYGTPCTLNEVWDTITSLIEAQLTSNKREAKGKNLMSKIEGMRRKIGKRHPFFRHKVSAWWGGKGEEKEEGKASSQRGKENRGEPDCKWPKQN